MKKKKVNENIFNVLFKFLSTFSYILIFFNRQYGLKIELHIHAYVYNGMWCSIEIQRSCIFHFGGKVKGKWNIEKEKQQVRACLNIRS